MGGTYLVRIQGFLRHLTFCKLTGVNVLKIKTEEMHGRCNRSSCGFSIFENEIVTQSLYATRNVTQQKSLAMLNMFTSSRVWFVCGICSAAVVSNLIA